MVCPRRNLLFFTGMLYRFFCLVAAKLVSFVRLMPMARGLLGQSEAIGSEAAAKLMEDLK